MKKSHTCYQCFLVVIFCHTEPQSMAFYTFQTSGVIGLISMDNLTIPQPTIVAIGDAPIAVAYYIKQKVGRSVLS